MKTKRMLKFEGIEPIYVKKKYNVGENRKEIHRISLFYPFKRAFFKLRVWLEWNWLELRGKNPQRCAMCGEDIAKVEVPEPNGKPEMIEVCERCRDWINDTKRKIMKKSLEEKFKEIRGE